MNPSFFIRRTSLNITRLFQRDIKEFYDTTTKVGQEPIAGRAWSASELRLKSFSDLHKLWFILAKEKNMLLTERALHKATHGQERFRYPMRLRKVKLSMARIKVVLGERKRIFEQARQKIKDMYIEGRRQQIIEQRMKELEAKLKDVSLENKQS